MPVTRANKSVQITPQSPITDPLNLTLDSTYGSEELNTLADLRRAVLDIVRALRSAGIVSNTVSLAYSSNGDQNGVFYYIGTNGITQNWSNPFTLGLVGIVASSLASGTVQMLVDRAQNSLWYTNNSVSSFVTFELNRYRLIPTDYTIRHSGEIGYYLRNWQLQGSNDNTNWTVLDTRVNDGTINGVNNWGRFSVSGVTTAYRYLRILQNGVNSSNNHYLVMAEVEFYGVLST